MTHAPIRIRKAAVLGAGVMGAQIAAHLANAGIEVLLFDLPAPAGPPNSIALKAIEALQRQNPAPLASKVRAENLSAMHYDAHLPLLTGCDLVIEAIAERMDWKLALYAKVAPHLGPRTLFATNTSGLSINALAQGFPVEQQARFCGIHFFNPPRYMHLVEIIPTAHTDPALLDALETFLVSTLGKGVVRARDTPNFVANRVGVFSMMSCLHNAARFQLRFDVVDDLTGPLQGRPKSATFRTADLVGLDIFAHAIKTLQDTLSDDPWYPLFQIPAWLSGLIAAGTLGAKTKGGVYRKDGKRRLVLDPATQTHIDAGQEADDAVKLLAKIKDPAKRLRKLRESAHPQARFLWACYRDLFHYTACQLEHIADNARDVDFAVRWGFAWAEGPFETWQSAGWATVAGWVAEDIAAGEALSPTPLPDWVFALADGVHGAQGSYSPSRQQWVPRSTLAVYQRQCFPAALKGEPPAQRPAPLWQNGDAEVWDSGEGVLVLSFTTKGHTISQAVLEGIHAAIDLAEAGYRGLVIWQPSEPFSLGADLASMLPAFAAGDWPGIDAAIQRFQHTMLRIRHCAVPVVAATQGYVFGGGCELTLHADRVVAHLESYVGLVEVGVGLLPAGGGLKEFALRAAEQTRGGDILASLKDAYMTIATAKVATSAEEAIELGFWRKADVVVFNVHELLHVARHQVIALAESAYRPPQRIKDFPVAGRAGAASIKGQLLNLREGGFISAYDYDIGALIADIITGGDVDAGTRVDEAWLLALERQGFMRLLRNEKTQERIAHMLEHNRPLRN